MAASNRDGWGVKRVASHPKFLYYNVQKGKRIVAKNRQELDKRCVSTIETHNVKTKHKEWLDLFRAAPYSVVVRMLHSALWALHDAELAERIWIDQINEIDPNLCLGSLAQTKLDQIRIKRDEVLDVDAWKYEIRKQHEFIKYQLKDTDNKPVNITTEIEERRKTNGTALEFN